MIAEKKEHYVWIKPEKNEFNNDLEKNSEIMKLIIENSIKFKDENIIVDFSAIEQMDFNDIALLLPQSDLHRENGTSFVIVSKVTGALEEPDELIIVPTLKEAEDVINLEDIERDLGI